MPAADRLVQDSRGLQRRASACRKSSAGAVSGQSVQVTPRKASRSQHAKREFPAKCSSWIRPPQPKLDAVRRLGGEVIKASFDACWKALGDRTYPGMNGAFIHPFEDDEFIAGNASAGLEILEDLPDVDAVVASFGGGGLSCGIAAAMKERGKNVKVFAAEPETAAPLARSFAAGSAQRLP